jgi:hypothetical protein
MEKSKQNIEDTTTALGWFERVLGMADKYRIQTVLKSVFIILLIAGTVGFIKNPTWIFEKYQDWQDKQHIEKLAHRLEHNEKLHIMTEKLMYKVNADRVLLLELHNGNTGLGGFPFAKCSATYEALNDGIVPVAHQYQDLNLSLMPFASKLFDEGYWCGDTQDLKEIDKALCYRMLGNDTSHFAGIVIQGVDKPIAFLFVKFKDIGDEHNCAEIKRVIQENAFQIALLLELNKH